VPRELFVRVDNYNEELERVASWKGLTDDDIKDIYAAKLANYDAGKSRPPKQHSASGFNNVFANFRDVPQFHQASIDQQNTEASERVKKYYNLMKRISSGSTRIE